MNNNNNNKINELNNNNSNSISIDEENLIRYRPKITIIHENQSNRETTKSFKSEEQLSTKYSTESNLNLNKKQINSKSTIHLTKFNTNNYNSNNDLLNNKRKTNLLTDFKKEEKTLTNKDNNQTDAVSLKLKINQIDWIFCFVLII